MPRKAEGGIFELVGSWGKLFVFGVLITILLIMMVLVYISSHPELGITIPPLFGG